MFFLLLMKTIALFFSFEIVSYFSNLLNVKNMFRETSGC